MTSPSTADYDRGEKLRHYKGLPSLREARRGACSGFRASTAFLAGWMSWFAHAVAGALYALGFGAFLFELARVLGMPWEAVGLDLGLAKKALGVAIAVAFAYVNFRGASETGLAGNVVTVAKLGVIGLFCAFGLKYMFFPEAGFEAGAAAGGMGTSQLRPFFPDETGWLGVLSAMGLTFIAFEGYEIIVQAGEEVKEPRRTIPKAVFLSLAIVVPVYMLVAFVLVGASNSPQLLEALREMGEEVPEGLGPDSPNWAVLRHVGELGLAQAAAQFIPYGAILILAGGMLSTMSALNATTFSSTRVSFAMGRDRNLPDGFARVHERNRTPHVALSWTAVLIVSMVAFVPITTVAAAADIMFLLLFLQVNVAVITLRKKYGDKLAYGYLMPFYPVVPVLGIVTKLALALFMFDHYPVAWFYVLAWLAAGFGIYHLWAAERGRRAEPLPIVVEEAPVELEPRSVLVGVAEPRSAAQLVVLGARIARALDSELVLLHVVAVPRQLPMRSGAPFAAEGREVVEGVRGLAETHEVPIRTLVRLAHRPAEAILRTAQDRHTDFLLLGWHGAKGRRAAEIRKPLIGRNIDRVIKHSNCHAVICENLPHPEEAAATRRVLVPLSDPATAPLALGVATALLSPRGDGQKITLLHLSDGPMSDEERARFREEIHEQMEETGTAKPASLFDESSPISLAFRPVERGVVADVVALSEDYDRIVVGTQRRGLLRRTVGGETSRAIADRARCPVVIVRPKEPAVKFNFQSFFQFFRELEEAGEPEGA